MIIKLSYLIFVFVSCNDIGKGILQKYSMMQGNKPESPFVQRVNSREQQWMLVPQLTRPRSQFNAEQSNQMARPHFSPHCVCSPQQYSKLPHNKPESPLVQSINSRKGCWYHSQQDHDPSLTLSNPIKWQDITLPPCVCSPQ